MNDERFHENIAQAIEEATPPLSDNVKERALAAMTRTRPVRWRPRLRFAAVGLAAVVALIGIGFVPFPGGKAPGAWNRVLAAAERMDSVHVAAFGWEKDKDGNRAEYFHDFWASKDTFARREFWKDGELWRLLILGHGRSLRYDADSRKADESYWPPAPAADALKQPWHKAWEWWQALAVGPHPSSYDERGWSLIERRETTLWGGSVDILEAELAVPSQDSGKIPKFKRRWEIDPSTDLPVSIDEYTFEDQRWVKTYWTQRIEWNVDVPESLRTFEIPPGTTLTRYTYWKQNADNVVATARNAQWQVVLRGLEADRYGRLYIGYSVRHISDGNASPDVKTAPEDVFAVGDTGGTYERHRGDESLGRHWTTRLDPQAAPGREATPRTVTLYFFPRGRGFPDLDQVVTLPDIPPPPQQDTDDVWSKYKEVIKY